jgi:hypothetical protein
LVIGGPLCGQRAQTKEETMKVNQRDDVTSNTKDLAALVLESYRVFLVDERGLAAELGGGGAIVAADIAHNFAAFVSSRSSSPKARNRATISGKNSAIRLPAGASIIAHTIRNPTITSSS